LRLRQWRTTYSKSNPRGITGRESSFRLHVWVPAWRARRRNDFQLTAARRRDLHLAVDAGGRTYDALRLRELIAQRLGTATPDRGRIAFGIRRACRCRPRRRVCRLRERHTGSRNEDERGDEWNCGAQGLLLTFAHTSVNVQGLPAVPVRLAGQAGNVARGFAIETEQADMFAWRRLLEQMPIPSAAEKA
jgi:hypothetical protein